MKLTTTLAFSAALAAIIPLNPTFAQDAPPPTVAEAPPVGAPAPPAVYNWRDVPANTAVVIDRAVFDPGGYQLYCQTGETIVVPFENQNLYVMRFGRSEDGATHFVNDGVSPTLLVPDGGYLENAAAQGARWYPFPRGYAYTGPVYMGVAPSYHEYVEMGWYPGMVYYGGYWGYHPYRAGIVFSPIPGLYFSIYDHPYHGWSEYHNYYYAHPEHRFYERSVVAYHYDNYRPRGAAYYSAHPDRGFVAEHRAAEHRIAVRHAVEHNITEHRAATMMPGGHPAGGAFGAARPAPNVVAHAQPGGGAFGGSKPAGGGSFGGASPTRGAFGAARPTGAFGGTHPTTPAGGSFGGAHPSTPGGGSFGGAHPVSSSTGGSFGGAHPVSPAGGSAFGGNRTTSSSQGSFGSHPGTAGSGSFGSVGSRSVTPNSPRSISSGSKSSPAKATPAPKK